MGDNCTHDKYRQFAPSSWTWIFIALLICLAVKAMHNKTAKGSYLPPVKVASIFNFISR